MKTITSLFILSILLLSSCSENEEYKYDYTFFDNSIMSGSYFHSSTTSSGKSSIKNTNGQLPVCAGTSFTVPNSLELKYTNEDGNWEALVIFPKKRGQTFFKESDHLSFWIYPEQTDPKLYPEIALSLRKRKRRSTEIESDKRSNYLPINNYITKPEKDGWKFVKIPLKDFKGFSSRPNAIVFSNSDTKGEGRILIDQLEFLPNMQPANIDKPNKLSAKGYDMHVDLTWPKIKDPNVKYIKIYRSKNNKDFSPVAIQRPYYNRFTDFTGETNKKFYYKISYLDYQYNETSKSKTAEASTRKFSNEELLNMVQEASFRYYWEGAEPCSGLARENIPGRKNMIATGASGFGIMAIVVGAERGFITREQAIQRMKRITTFLKGCDKYHGAVSHFMDGTTGKTIVFFGQHDNGGDLVETSFLYQGLLVAREYFDKDNPDEKEVRQAITELWEGVEWNWYDQDKDGKVLTWHWSKNYGFTMNHKLIGWNETMITYILAMASPTYPVKASMYYTGWANQETMGKNYRSNWGGTLDGSTYSNGNTYHGINLDVGVANGGPLFFVHYSFMGMDPHKVTDKYTNYFENNRNIALINWKYCTSNPNNFKGYNDSFWGLTACDGPWGYRAVEPRKERDNGTVSPTGALASFPYTPKQSMAALKNMYRNHGKYLWGEYGFRDGLNLQVNWHSEIFMGLNQAPVTVMIENHRTGLIWNLFMKNKEIQKTLKKLQNP